MRQIAPILIALAVTLSLASGATAAEDPLNLSQSEIVDRVAQGTGMAKNAVKIALGNTPSNLKVAADLLTGVQIITQFADARDEAASATALNWALGKVKDVLITGPVSTVLASVTLYKATLEGLRDFVVLPHWDEQMYQSYKSAREELETKGNRGPAVSESAFETATMSGNAYFALKGTIYAEIIRAKGLQADIIGPRYEAALRAQIDAYWEARMSLHYAHDYVIAHRAEILAAYWTGMRNGLKATTAAVPATTTAAGRVTTTAANTSAEDQAAVNRYIAAQEARVSGWIEADRKSGKMSTQYRWEWVIKPHIENGYMVVASGAWQKPDNDHAWFETGTFGSAAAPFRIPIAEIKRDYPPK
jgi:hypothetical protein